MNREETIKVLLLEDDVDDYRLIAKQLSNQRCHFVIDWAETLAAAVERLNRHSFDVILTDLSVPDSVGLQTVSQLRKHCSEAPIIVLTSLEDECVEREILSAGAQDYLVKGETGGRAVIRPILHAAQRQRAMNEVKSLVSELEQSQQLLQEQAQLLRRKNHRLRRLYKTAHEFVDNVSHDFRTPLTVIKDYIAIIREGMVGSINDEQRAMLDKVSVRTDDLNNMVDDLLDVSKLESGLLGAWRRNIQVQDLMTRAESLLQQRAQVKQVELIVECEADLPAVYCDADKAGRVLTNLAVNAIKFAGDQGRVQIWAEADLAGHQVVIGVTDNGPGIDQQSLGKIFQRFRQVDRQLNATVKGFGLGLNIAQQLSRLNLGELSVNSQLGQGSTFSFTLPVADPTEVLRRWLRVRGTGKDFLRVIEISVAAAADAAAADEFDSFLNCLLRSDDLLFRVTTRNWILVMSVSPSEADGWFKRAESEFGRLNRNRPMGPLPEYRTETRCQWAALDTKDKAVLQEFEAIIRQVNEAVVAM